MKYYGWSIDGCLSLTVVGKTYYHPQNDNYNFKMEVPESFTNHGILIDGYMQAMVENYHLCDLCFLNILSFVLITYLCPFA